jgi:peroxiredoxin
MAERNTPVNIGEVAPDFTLNAIDGEKFTLSAFKGKKVLLSFHPLAWTDVCAQQMESLEASADIFESLNTVAAGINVDPQPGKKTWAGILAVKKIRLLSDFWPHGEVSKAYGLFREKQGFSERANVIVGEDGRVAFVKVYPISELPDIKEIIEELKK